MMTQDSASESGQKIADISNRNALGTEAGDSLIESLTHTTSNLATTNSDAVHGDDLSYGRSSISPSPECDLCRKWLTTKPLMRSDYVPLEEIFPTITTGRSGQPFSFFTKSARSGCRGCEVLVEGALLYSQSIGRKEPDSIRFDQILRLYAKLFWEDEDKGQMLNKGIDVSEFEYFVPHASKGLQAWKGLQPSKNLQPDTRSEERMVTLELLVEVCNTTHTGPCQVERKAPLPSRVIDLGIGNTTSEDMVRLRESMPDETDHYIVLSHCWGEFPIPRTLTDNLADMEKGIRLESLPQTFQDAILLTRRFDVRYLWIDSLCIIQDDDNDWKREASKMADVYGNSYLTIAASAAKDGSIGCLVPRTTPAACSFKVDLSSCGPAYGKNEVLVRQRLHQRGGLEYFMGIDVRQRRPAPLEERAWTFQEGLLPRRILHLYSDEVHFQCESETICECLLQRSSATRMNQLVETKDSAMDLSNQWRSFVTKYSGRNITYLKDRLPALAGVASKFYDVTKGDYVAGMWKHSILDDLQWHTEVERPAERLHGDGRNRLPSWSWLSTTARVTWYPRDSVVPGEECQQINEATIHEADTLFDKDFPFGQVSGALLMMEGFTLPATIRYISPAEARASRGNSSAHVWPDYDYSKLGYDHVKDGSEVLLFLICQQYTPPYFENSMLVLRKVPLFETEPEVYEGLYERIGYARLQISNNFFNPGEKNPDFNFQGPRQMITMLSGYGESSKTVVDTGALHRDQGKLAEAKQMYLRTLAWYEKELGAEHTSTLGTINNFGNLFVKQGELVEAEQIYLRALAGMKKALGVEHTSALAIVHNLGNLYRDQGKLVEAEQMYLRALVGREKALGAEHIPTLSTVHNLGLLYRDQGKLAEAEQMYLRALVGYDKALGAEYTSTLNTIYNLGNLYCDQGKLVEAEQMYLRALVGYDKALGAEHTSTLRTVNDLGNLYRDQGKLAEAEQMYLRALAGREKALGAEHIPTLDTVNNLGLLYLDQGKLVEAEQMYLRALAGMEKALGAEHTLTLETVNNLRVLYIDQDKLAEAEQMYLRMLAGYEKALGAEHTSTLIIVYNLGNLYRDQGKLAEAEQMYLRMLVEYEKALGAEYTSTLDTIHNLGNLYCDQGKLAEAEQMYLRALVGYDKALGAEHTSTLRTVNNLGIVYREQGKLGEMINLVSTWASRAVSLFGALGRLLLQNFDDGNAQMAFQQQIDFQDGCLVFATIQCDGCGLLITCAKKRFVCRHCSDGDFCGQCFNKHQAGTRKVPSCLNHSFLEIVSEVLSEAEHAMLFAETKRVLWFQDLERQYRGVAIQGLGH